MDDTKRNQIITELWHNREEIFGNIRRTKLKAYNTTQTGLHANVETDRAYQSNYIGFYFRGQYI